MATRPTAKRLNVRRLCSQEPGFERAFAALADRRNADGDAVEQRCRAILERVRQGGDPALLACIEDYDGARLQAVEVGAVEWDAAVEGVDPAARALLGKAATRVREFHRARVPASWEMREEGGARLGHRIHPLERVGIYAPGGQASYPSSVIMNAIPASVAGVAEIALASPPRSDGTLPASVLLAARLAGVHRVFKMGGAHAIAAFAYGTAAVPAVDKITGPGSIWVAAAKRLVFGQVGIDSEAGPTEVLVVADQTATPAWVAADLISQAEHDERAQAILLSLEPSLAERVSTELERQLAPLSRAATVRRSLEQRGAIVLCRDLEEALTLTNDYAPEHLVLAVAEPEAAMRKIRHAGAIFLGHYTPVAVGDYLAGPNHVLPTGGTARFFSPLGVEDFLKRSSFVRFEPAKLRELGGDVIQLAALEGLTAHGASVQLRLDHIPRRGRAPAHPPPGGKTS